MMTPIKADNECRHCFRVTEFRCGQCRERCCPLHSWTQVTKVKIIMGGVVGHYDEYRGVADITMPARYHALDLCRMCRDVALKVAA